MGILSDIKDKFVDDIIPNELKSGAKAKESLRKLIPNEVADIAVKAAPFVAMIPGQQGTAALMRGLGRFDQRGSISDALKQGLGTYAFGKISSPLTSKIPGIGESYEGASGILDFGKDAYKAAKTGGKSILEKTREGDYLKKAKNFGKKMLGIDSDGEDGENESKGILDVGMEFLTDPKKTIPLAMLATYIKEKFFPGETQPSPYNVAMGKRGDDVASYLSRYGEYSPLRDPNKNPYSQAEKDKFVADNIVEYRNLPTYAGGGRVELNMGGGADDIFDQYEKKLLEQEGYDPSSPEKYGSDREMGIITLKDILDVLSKTMGYQDGGRVNFGLGSLVAEALTKSDVVRPLVGAGKNKADDILDAITGKISFKGAGKAMPQPVSNTLSVEDILKISDEDDKDNLVVKLLSDVNFDRVNRAYGSDDKVEKASMIEGLDINVNPKGIMELDMREEGGFIPPVGVKEKADDIPAMLSNNEFVFTADAVRAAGGGSVDKGAQRMYQMMKNLEAKA